MDRPTKKMLFTMLPLFILAVVLLVVIYQNVDPAPPDHLKISTGDDQNDLQEYAEQYRDLLKEDGVTLEIEPSPGPIENLRRLEDDKSDISAAFVPDGLGSPEEQSDVESLGSLFYQPIWVFYRGHQTLNHLSQLEGKRIGVGRLGHGTHVIAGRLLRLSGVDMKKTHLYTVDSKDAAEALKKGRLDAAMMMKSADDPLVHELIMDKDLHLLNIQQAEGISRQDASFHHLVLPRGSIDLKTDMPREDVNLVSTTVTLLVRDDLHPALAFLLLKAAKKIHSGPGILEKRGEFPENKDDQFPLSDDALQFYKTGGPFWQRYLPYWLAAWFDRFILLVIPILAFALPLLRLIPRIYQWRIRSKIYQRYGELKFLETKIKPQQTAHELKDFQKQLDMIEERVDKMKLPQNYTEYLYSLKGHIQFVRDRLNKTLEKTSEKIPEHQS